MNAHIINAQLDAKTAGSAREEINFSSWDVSAFLSFSLFLLLNWLELP